MGPTILGVIVGNQETIPTARDFSQSALNSDTFCDLAISPAMVPVMNLEWADSPSNENAPDSNLSLGTFVEQPSPKSAHNNPNLSPCVDGLDGLLRKHFSPNGL